MDRLNKTNNKLKAFTLAETLITILIIGILMAIMLRTISRVNPDKDKILFLKSYHAVESAISSIINDGTKYNQTYLSEADRTALPASERHHDFRDDPLDDASVMYVNNSGSASTKTNLGRSESICYFLADQFNTIGGVSCDSNSGIQVDGKTVTGANFRTSNGVCFDNWHGVSNTGQLDGVIDPNCEGASNGYVIRVFRDGKITVPETVNGYDNQSKAYAWLQKQAEIK